MPETLSNLGTSKVDAEERENVTGQMTEILALSPNDGLRLILSNIVDGMEGIPIYANLVGQDGDPLPLDTKLVLRWDAPHLDQPQVVSFALDNIRQYRTLSIKEQQNEDFRDRTRNELKGRTLTVEDNEEVQVAVLSSEVIDWAASEVYIDENAVTVRSN
ncbi:hypothetical protein [Halolamina sp. C58]|uniref:hypothetical protein n=1 Tax=Halolamina sp. C58 TaxID=3421640 RepID=UPI003EBB4EC1